MSTSPFVTSPVTLGRAINSLRYLPSVSVPILSDSFRQTLLTDAKRYPLRAARDTVGSGKNQVHQDMVLQDKLDMRGPFGKLVTEFQKLFDRAVDEFNLFSEPVVFNDVMLQKYEVGSRGITPHRDRTDYRHIICLFILAGHGRFFIADDREKNNEIEIANFPGDVLLMPGPGFCELAERPFHYLENVTEDRWVFGLRHDQSKL